MTKLRLIFLVFAALSFNLATGQSSPLNPNDTEAEELAALPHVDQTLAQTIIAARPMSDNLALEGVLAGILDKGAIDDVLVDLFIPINLNTASRDEIMLVPGMSRRMAHEFEEYRPYTSMEQFRREIGKYVDDDEVARFERYVTLGE